MGCFIKRLIDMISYFTLQLNFKKLPLIIYWCSIKEKIHDYLFLLPSVNSFKIFLKNFNQNTYCKKFNAKIPVANFFSNFSFILETKLIFIQTIFIKILALISL